MSKKLMVFFISILLCHCTTAQKTISFNLADLLKENQLITDTSNHAISLNDSPYTNAVSLQNIVWLKNISFKEGTVDVDLRGKDVFLRSFLGIAFHAQNAGHYELVYFRPFNFLYSDTARRRWSLQYMVIPDYPWNKLRQEHPLVYENCVIPAPEAGDWFHATIVVTRDSIKVYVNHSAIPSLQVKKLGNLQDGMIGLWDDGLSGDFANLTIKQ